MINRARILCGIFFVLRISSGLEYNNQHRLSTNTDFLLHEGAGQIYGQNKANAGQPSQTFSSPNGGKRDYVAQPPSNNMNSVQQRNPQSSNGKRDYVAPQLPTHKPAQSNNQLSGGNNPSPIQNNQSGGKPSYASQFPALSPSSQSHTSVPNHGPQSNAQSSNRRRDYVNPQFTTLKPVQQSNNHPAGGKVKDLINFYDSKNPTQGTHSYSSILQGSNKNGPSTTVTLPSTRYTQPVTPSTLSTSSSHTPKPMSFSSVVAGNKPSSSGTTFTTSKPTTRIPSTPMSRPSSPVLPSSIVNNNRGTSNTNTVSDAELEALSEELLRKDSNNAAKYITVNYQEKTTSQSKEDKAPLPLITISPEVWNIPTIQTIVPLLDNYERDTLVNEHVTPQERNEENAFMDAVMSTAVMRHLMTYLKNKGYVTPDPKQQRDFLKQLWFSLYSRGKGKISSSGFEHIFVSEFKNGDVSGLHNWIYFAREESANRANYLGYLKYVQLNDKGVVMKLHFNQQGTDKPVNSMFIGTSPELEMALYTLCFVTRADNECKLKLANKDVNIVTYTFRYRSKNLIGSAYPQI